MKIVLHIPVEQYGFIEVEVLDVTQEAKAETIKEIYDEYSLAFKSQLAGPGLDRDAWNECLDSYNNGNPMNANTYESLNEWQQKVIQENKKSFKRIESKSNKNV